MQRGLLGRYSILGSKPLVTKPSAFIKEQCAKVFRNEGMTIYLVKLAAISGNTGRRYKIAFDL